MSRHFITFISNLLSRKQEFGYLEKKSDKDTDKTTEVF